ncbi:MAG: bifunctional metallophosphatase/5'-nucleotidase [Betaproteobacteria bacterium]|nr:bifunctional metallophosphatase/5'-nucleotidase [Betaproteobacteria bacterium]
MKMNKLVSAVCGALLTASVSAFAADVNVKLIGFNDFHGNLKSPGNFSGNPAGGADYLAGYIASLKAQNPNTVVIHAGDMVGASPLVSALFHDEPTIEAMNKIGVDIASVGNHEFDEGRTELIRMKTGGCHPTDANSCKGPDGTFKGARFQFLAANVIDKATGQPLFPRYVVKTFGGVRMAFIGMTLEGTPTIVTPTGVAGLDFKDEADTVNSLIKTLRNQGVNAITIVVHEGGTQSGPIGGCTNMSGAILDIVNRLDSSVDLVISGHTHQAYVCQLPNAQGKMIPVTSASAFGRVLTNIDVVLDTVTRDVKSVTASQVVVNRNNASITPNAEIAALVTHYDALVAPIANQVIGKISQTVDRSTNAACEHESGDLIADAQLAATQAPEFGGAVAAFMNPGGVRADFAFASSAAGEGDGNITYGESFTVQPFGNSLVTMSVTGAQIKTMLEQQFVGCGQPAAPTGFNRVLQVSKGFEYEWDRSGGVCARVVPGSVKLNGAPINDAQIYRVTVNNFLADGGDGFVVLKNGTDRLGGAVDVDALTDFLKPTLSPAPTGTPYVPPALTRIKQKDATVTSCPSN